MSKNNTNKKNLLNVLSTILDINFEKDIIFIKNSNFEYIYANQAFCEEFDVNLSDILGKTDNFFIKDRQTLSICHSSDVKAYRDSFLIVEEESSTARFKVLKLKINLGNGNSGIFCFAKKLH